MQQRSSRAHDASAAVLTLLVLATGACATRVVPPPVSPIAAPDLVLSVFLLGDAGSPKQEPDANLVELARQAAGSPAGSVIVFLGDNIYPNGLPDTADP